MKLAVEGIFFDHVQKTGGTSLYEWLSAWLGPARVAPMYGSRHFAEAMSESADRVLISGHFYFLPGDSLDPARLNVTVLRDPVDRVLSEYYFNRFDVPNLAGSSTRFTELAKSLSLEELIEHEASDVAPRFRNAQTMHYAPLAGFVDESTTPDPGKYAQAALHGFDLVGTQEQLDRFARLLGEMLGMDPATAPALPRAKVSSRRIDRDQLDRSTRKRLEELNQADYALIETAGRLEEEQHAAFADFLARFRTPVRMVQRQRGTEPGATYTAMPEFGSREIEITLVEIAGDISWGPEVVSGEMTQINVRLKAHVDEPDATVGIRIVDAVGRVVHGTNTRLLGAVIGFSAGQESTVAFRCRMDVGVGAYFVGASVHRGKEYSEGTFHVLDRSVQMTVVGVAGPQFEGYSRLLMATRVENLHVELTPIAASLTLDTPCMENTSARIRVVSTPARIRPGEIFTIDTLIANTGTETWPVEGLRPFVAAYKWRDPATGGTIVEEGDRTRLPWPIRPGDEIRLPVVVRAPASPVRAVAEVWLLQERCQWVGVESVPIEVAD